MARLVFSDFLWAVSKLLALPHLWLWRKRMQINFGGDDCPTTLGPR